MAWVVVIAALGGSLITGLFSYLATKHGAKSADQRTIRELEGRLAQLEREQKHELLREAIKRRTDFRRERLIPLQEQIGSLIVLSSRFTSSAGDIFMMDHLGEPPTLPNAKEEYKKIEEEIGRFRREQLGFRPWWGVASRQLIDLFRKLNGDLATLERESREYAEYGGPTKDTKKRAQKAFQELDNSIMEIAKEIEGLISGNDLVGISKDS